MINPIRILIGVMLISLFNLTTALAEITIDGETIHVETNNYKVQFDRGVITQLHNKLTNDTYTRPPQMNRGVGGETGILKRDQFSRARHANRDLFIWTRHATTVETRKIDFHTAETVFRRGGDEIRIVIGIDPQTDDLLISGDCVSDTPKVYGIQWGIGHLDLYNLDLILPSHGGRIINDSDAVTYENFYYPNRDWAVQLAIIQAENGGFYVRGTDTTFQFKELNYQTDTGEFGLGFRTHNQAPWDGLTEATSVTWRLNTYVGDWCVPAQIYRDWMEAAFDPWRLSEGPAWVNDIGLIVFYSHLETEALESLAELVDPTKTLLYLPNWRIDRQPINYPDYIPKDELGGFVEEAHRLGYRVMPHVSLYDCSPDHPLYPELKRFQYRLPWNEELTGWVWDQIDNPERNAHISLASSRWRNLLVQRFKAVWDKYNVDAFHFDVSHYVLNDANGLIEGLTSAEGNVLMNKQLAEAMPGVVFAGEEFYEVTFFRESFAIRVPSETTPHPINVFLFSPYIHLHGGGVRAIEEPEYHTMLNAFEGRGVLPTLSFGTKEDLDRPLTRQMLSVVRQWQDLRLKPDIGCDWGPNTLFQYTTQTGETATYQRTSSGSVFILPNDGGYERVYNATQAQTHRSLPHWRAYNDTHLIGLDPNRAYFLNDASRDFSQVRVNSLSPDVYISETRVTNHAALFRFESTGSDRQTTVGFFLPTPPVGSIPNTLRPTDSGHYTLEVDLSQPIVIVLAPPQQISLPYNLWDARYTSGLQLDDIFRFGSLHGSGERTRTHIDNTSKDAFNALPPANGQTVIQFPLSLPEEPSTFSFSVGLHEGCSKGVLFQIRLNGQTYFEAFKDTFDWTDGSISLSAFAGQSVLLELVTDPAQEGNEGADCDSAFWADLHITASPNPDANLDGQVNILDLILVASGFGEQPPSNPQADTNKDGVVNLLDLVFVAEHLSQNAAAPSQLAFIESIPPSAKEVIAAQRALTELEAIPNKTPRIQLAIELLRHYLSIADRNIKETKLLPNYPNPFNPDTWIPYQLSEASTVTVKIYDVTGSLIRTINVGHKPTGYHLTRERAVYWDGRNEKGESVSSGVYFYTLNTDTYTQTRRMVILK